MPLTKCPRCGKLFNKETFVVCTPCVGAEEADYTKVRDALQERQDMNAEEAAELAGVEVEVVTRMLDQGEVISLRMEELKAGGIVCRRCGAPATDATRKLCKGCVEQLNREMGQAQHTVRESMPAKSTQPTAGFVRKAFSDKRRV